MESLVKLEMSKEMELQRPPGRWRQWQMRREHARREQSMHRELRSGRFILYGLPPEFDCIRFVGGWGCRNGETTRLELAHLPPHGDLERQIRVEVIRRDPHENFESLKADLDRGLWTQVEIRNVVPDVTGAQQWSDAVHRVEESYAPGVVEWNPVQWSIDGAPTEFTAAEYGPRWVALAERDGGFLVVAGERWKVDPELTTITDVEPYIEGSEVVRRLGLASGKDDSGD